MKTSVIEVRDMLSVLSVLGLEKRIGQVPGVESATVNYAAGNATVRYDETRLDIADIKSDVRQSGYESAAPASATPKAESHEGRTAPSAPSGTPAPVAPKSTPDATAAALASAAPKAEGHEKPAAAVAQTPTPVAGVPKPSPAAAPKSAAPKSPPDAAAAATANAVPGGDGKQDKAATEKR